LAIADCDWRLRIEIGGCGLKLLIALGATAKSAIGNRQSAISIVNRQSRNSAITNPQSAIDRGGQ
jgi:uracil-DNA glycosylase